MFIDSEIIYSEIHVLQSRSLLNLLVEHSIFYYKGNAGGQKWEMLNQGYLSIGDNCPINSINSSLHKRQSNKIIHVRLRRSWIENSIEAKIVVLLLILEYEGFGVYAVYADGIAVIGSFFLIKRSE